MEAQGGRQKLNESTERYVFILTDDKAINCFLTLLYNEHRITELGQKTWNLQCLKCNGLLCLISMQETLLTNLWPNCRYHCSHICVFERSKLTAVVVVGQLRVVKNMMNCIWQSRLTENKTPSSSIHSFFFFQACRRGKQLAKHNAKDDARLRAKAAYHHMNELGGKLSDKEDSANENAELSDNEKQQCQ
jgi:hypothetical protein